MVKTFKLDIHSGIFTTVQRFKYLFDKRTCSKRIRNNRIIFACGVFMLKMAPRCFVITQQVIRLLGTLILHALFFALLITKIKFDSLSWEVVFVPLFIFDFFAILYTIVYLIQYCMKKINDWENSEEADESVLITILPVESTELPALLFFSIGLCLKVTAEVLLLIHLTGQIDRPYVPGILFCLLFAETWVAFIYYSLFPHTVRTARL